MLDITTIYDTNDSIIKERLKIKYHRTSIFNALGCFKDRESNLDKEDIIDKKSRKVRNSQWKSIWKFIIEKYSNKPKKVSCFYLFYYERSTQPEIASVLGCSQEYVNKLLNEMTIEVFKHFKVPVTKVKTMYKRVE